MRRAWRGWLIPPALSLLACGFLYWRASSRQAALNARPVSEQLAPGVIEAHVVYIAAFAVALAALVVSSAVAAIVIVSRKKQIPSAPP